MAFKKDDSKKGLSLPGMIDIIFLLLIFSIVTLSYTDPSDDQNNEGENNVDLRLPVVNSNITENKDEILQTLMLELRYINDDANNPIVVYVLKPSADTTNYQMAKYQAIHNAVCDTFPGNFLILNEGEFNSLPACQLISNSIQEYAKKHFTIPSPYNTIEVRADKNIKFRVFNYILNLCSSYDDRIPRVIIRTLSQ